jgi:hypothetical protein
LPAAIVLCAVSIFVAAKGGTLHPLYKGDLKHIFGYVLWTIYQQFLLQDFFMDRLLRMMPSGAAVTMAGILFATAHLPNLVLTAACVVWGIVSCVLFRRYGNLWVLGLAQGMLGLCFAIWVPDSLHHHLRVGDITRRNRCRDANLPSKKISGTPVALFHVLELKILGWHFQLRSAQYAPENSS